MMKGSVHMKIIIKLIPLLFLYILIVILFANQDLFWGDEGRYVKFAKNLTQGYYSTEDDINLWNGPGYPLVLLPFVIFNVPLLSAKLMNAIFLFIAILYFYHTLRFYMQERHAVYFSYLLGIYPPFFTSIFLLLTETFSILLVCGFLFHFCKLHREERLSRIHSIVASSYLGYLALTKIFFGYVILAGLLLSLFLYILKKRDVFKKTLLVYLLALFLCSPYLLYTYSLTNRIFYWGDSGGLSLYWISNPYEYEYGDWFDFGQVHENPQLAKHHNFFKKVEVLPSLQRDDELKRQAVKNIMQYPGKYLKNVSANIGRMLFNYPYSFVSQRKRTLFYMMPNMFLVVSSIMCIYPYFARRKIIPGEIHIMFVFFLISFSGSSLLSAYPRQFTILVPVLLIWLFFVITRVVRIELRN